jgi:small neutral amino acid transporter SnatA (MarC family)
MLFFALCGACILHYLAILLSAFKIARGIILLLIAIDMLSNKRWKVAFFQHHHVDDCAVVVIHT